MDLTALIARLDTVAELAQVIEAQPGGFQTPVDSSTELVARLSSVVAGKIYPVTQRDQRVYPSIVYQLVSSQVGQIDGYRVTQSDRYVLQLRAATYDEVITKLGSMIAGLAGSSYAIEVNDVLFDWDDAQEAYRANVDVEFTYLSAALQTKPAAFVYALDRSADESAVDNVVHQRITNSYAIVIVTSGGNMPALLDAVMTSLLGWQQSAAHDDFQYVGGSNLEGVAGLEVWRETYRDAEYVQQA